MCSPNNIILCKILKQYFTTLQRKLALLISSTMQERSISA